MHMTEPQLNRLKNYRTQRGQWDVSQVPRRRWWWALGTQWDQEFQCSVSSPCHHHPHVTSAAVRPSPQLGGSLCFKVPTATDRQHGDPVSSSTATKCGVLLRSSSKTSRRDSNWVKRPLENPQAGPPGPRSRRLQGWPGCTVRSGEVESQQTVWGPASH